MIKKKIISIYQATSTQLQKEKVQSILLLIEILVCTLVFLTLSGGKGIDFDEAFTFQLVRDNNMLGIIRDTAADVHPPLYYLIVKLFTTVFGYKFIVYTWASIAAAIGCMILNSTLIY